MYDNWEQLEANNKQCRKCRLCQTRNNVVFGTGNKGADLMFIGEGPGADEDLQGEPFVGKAGKLMNMAFDVVGLKREEVYIANIVKCRPPSNRNPEDDEAAACLNYLRNQVILVRPKIIVLLGSIALKNILGKEYGITASRGKWIEKKGILYLPTWHPAALLRDETKKIDFIKDLKLVMEKNMEQIKEKSNYCLNCPIKPCSNRGCPLGNDIPGFINAVKQEDYKKAYEILSETTVLQAICGRICPHTKQCEGSCIRGIKSNPVNIGELEAFVGDIAIKENYTISKPSTENKNKKIAIVGGGPAGLTASAFLLKKGYSVTVYEKYDYLGGLLVHGIPEFRLPKEVVKQTIQKIIDLGLEVKYNQELGRNLELQQLEKEYDAIFLAFGANVTTKMGVEGEDLQGVYGGNQLLEYQNHPDYTNKKVTIIGGGNVAMDCARTIKRLGAQEVKVIYRRAEEQMPAETREIQDAKQEGIEFLLQNNIVKILGKNKVQHVELIKTELVEKEGETRKVPINIPNSNYIIDIDYVVMALGSGPDSFVKNLGLELNKWGYINIDEKNRTSNPKIFAGGDIAGSKGTVAWAARAGRDAANAMIEYLQ